MDGCIFLFSIPVTFRLFKAYCDTGNQGQTALALLALLLFTLPLLFTFQKFVVLDTLGERSQKLLADQDTTKIIADFCPEFRPEVMGTCLCQISSYH